jgi:hypothetical protein
MHWPPDPQMNSLALSAAFGPNKRFSALAHRLTLLRQRQIRARLPVAPPVTVIAGTATLISLSEDGLVGTFA